MKTILFLLSFIFLSLSINAQSSNIAKAYFEAIQKKKIAPLAPYFLSVDQQIKVMVWPDIPEARQMLDSFNTMLKDSLLVTFQSIHQELQQQGISLKNSKLVSSKRQPGVQGVLELTLTHQGEKASIFTRVVEVKGKDYHFMDAIPSLKAPALSPTAYMTINQVEYPLWAMRKIDREKANQILEKNHPFQLEGKELPPYSYFLFPQGIITQDQHYYAYVKVSEKEGSNSWVILIDLEEEKIASFEKEIPVASSSPIQKPTSIPELLEELEQKKGKELVEKFLVIQQKSKALGAFIDSLRRELIEQTGGYEEINGYSRPVGKKNKIIPEKILLQEGHAVALKEKMLALEREWLQLIPVPIQRKPLKEKLNFNFGEERARELGMTWEEYIFGQMPLAAIIPMLRKYQKDIKGAEWIVLQHLLEEE